MKFRTSDLLRLRRAPLRTLGMILMGYAVVLGVLAMVGLADALLNHRSEAQTREVLLEAYGHVVDSTAMINILPAMPVVQEDYFDPEPNRTKAERRFDERRAQFERSLAHAQSIAGADDRKDLGAIADGFQGFVRFDRALRVLAQNGEEPEGLWMAHTQYKNVYEPLAAACLAFRDRHDQQVAASRARLYDREREAERTIGLLLAIALGVSAATAIAISRTISEPIRLLEKEMRAVATGEFDQVSFDYAPAFPLEMRSLVASFHQMTRNLAELTREKDWNVARLRDAIAREHGLNADLQQASRDLGRANAELEARVAERTEELRQANERLEASVQELKQLDRLKADFLAAMSHELRTPLAVIKGAALTVVRAEDKLKPEKRRQMLENIVSGADGLLRQVNDLLDYAKMQAGRFAIKPSATDFGALVRRTVEGALPLAAAKQVAIALELPEEPPLLEADGDRLGQVLVNLLHNAIKFSPADGRIVVRVSLVRREGEAEPARLLTEVQDQGPGIAPEAQIKLFNPFYQVDNTATRAHGGTGLGLAIARQLVEAHGGAIGVRSAEGEGSTFGFELPIVVAKAPEDPDEVGAIDLE